MYLEVEGEEGIVREEAVAAWSCHDVAGDRRVHLKTAPENGGCSVHKLIHVAAHSIQGQIVSHLKDHKPFYHQQLCLEAAI